LQAVFAHRHCGRPVHPQVDRATFSARGGRRRVRRAAARAV
jgi:hypothetical protein